MLTVLAVLGACVIGAVLVAVLVNIFWFIADWIADLWE